MCVCGHEGHDNHAVRMFRFAADLVGAVKGLRTLPCTPEQEFKLQACSPLVYASRIVPASPLFVYRPSRTMTEPAHLAL